MLVLHGPAMLLAGPAWFCGTGCMVLQLWVLTLHGPAALGAGAAPSCGTVGGFCTATCWVWGSRRTPRAAPAQASPAALPGTPLALLHLWGLGPSRCCGAGPVPVPVGSRFLLGTGAGGGGTLGMLGARRVQFLMYPTHVFF